MSGIKFIKGKGIFLNNTCIVDEQGVIGSMPIGAYYITDKDEIIDEDFHPSNRFGGTWEKTSQGRVLTGAGTLNNITYTLGEEISAGLPNITGSLDIPNGNKVTGNTYFDVQGAFAHYGNAWDSGNASGAGLGGRIGFEASRSNSIYGGSSTVQPNTLVVNIWKRVS